ncbi:HAD-IC family P-type ATPase [Patescibacteria group bacterium]|nr:HAD-IC family P-type ATPase [Patescibacteria group bacterium]MBU1673956.1 HAD-IC family P-type ATPase [Patescibacteria group bacterium]MBU1963950.1 HAD-IC family P-type ATPase [Patescibacteria group bacterium]
MPEDKKEFFAIPKEQVIEHFNSSKDGLSTEEVKKRLEQYGKNKLPQEKRASWLIILLSQFKSPLVYILVVAAIISLAVKEWVDAGVILASVIINTIVGFLQELKADNAVEQLSKLVHFEAIVKRKGVKQEVPAEELVPGDIILLEAGDKVPADARLFECNSLEINEAPLTGESMPIKKQVDKVDPGTPMADRKNMVHMGTNVTRGKGRAIIISTGIHTNLGEIASMVKEVKEDKTPLQVKLGKFSTWLAVIVAGLSILIFVIGLIQGKGLFEMFLMAVAIAVAAIPEGLIISMTVVLTIGMQKVVKQNALIKKLIAAETLGSVSVICSDKTGTLTVGRMEVAVVNAKNKEAALKLGMLCNNAVIQNPNDELAKWKMLGDPTETALVLGAVHAGINQKQCYSECPRIGEIPFDEDRKYMITQHETKRGCLLAIKGAPEKVLGFAKLSDEDREKYRKQFEEMTSHGLRVLAIAQKRLSCKIKLTDKAIEDCEFVGFIGLKDPLREEAKSTLEMTIKAGIKPVIITGDHKLTAQAIGRELGMPVADENIMEGKVLEELTDEELKEKVVDVDIYARVTPRHKLRIIDAWQARGEVVAMAGDGVNDAPAIKSADVGIALGSGTDVAKETADVILLDDNFKTINSAVEGGRIIYANIKKIILFLMSGSFTEVIVVIGALLLGLPLPVVAVQILWINLVEDSFPNLALAFEKGEPEVMQDKPRPKKEPILDKEMKIMIFGVGIFRDIILLALFYVLWKWTNDLPYCQTIIFVALGIDTAFIAFSFRTMRHTIWQRNPFSNWWLNGAVLIGIGLIVAAVYMPFLQVALKTVPLGPVEWAGLILLALMELVAMEIVKYIFIVRHKVKI